MIMLSRRLPSLMLRGASQVRRLTQNIPIKEKTIGVIGMGMVGNAVTKNLLRNGYNVTTIFDIDQSKLEEFKDSCKIASNSQAVVSEVDIFVTALPKPHNLKEAFEGEDGMYKALSRDQIWIDHSTTDFEQTKSFTDMVSGKGAHLLEAPVTGGLEALRKGQMTVLVAGENDVFEYIRPILETNYMNIIFTGGSGTALIPKAISNVIAAMFCVAASEALVLCKRIGMDEKTTFDAIRAGAGNSFAWETAVPYMCQGIYDDSFTLDLHCKDNQLMFDIAKRSGVPVELMGHVQQIYNRALAEYGGESPCYIPAKLMEDVCGESFKNDAFKDWSYSIENIDGSLVIRHHGIETPRTGHPIPE